MENSGKENEEKVYENVIKSVIENIRELVYFER